MPEKVEMQSPTMKIAVTLAYKMLKCKYSHILWPNRRDPKYNAQPKIKKPDIPVHISPTSPFPHHNSTPK